MGQLLHILHSDHSLSKKKHVYLHRKMYLADVHFRSENVIQVVQCTRTGFPTPRIEMPSGVTDASAHYGSEQPLE